MARFILKTLREAPGPLTDGDLARRFMVARGEPGTAEGAALRVMTRRMATALRHQELGGAAAAAREPGRPVLWEISRG